VPYVGAGVLASAVGMDKAIMKVVLAAAGLPVCPYRVVLRHDWQANRDEVAAELERALHYPMFVKPANLGSSVGISKAKARAGLIVAVTNQRTHKMPDPTRRSRGEVVRRALAG